MITTPYELEWVLENIQNAREEGTEPDFDDVFQLEQFLKTQNFNELYTPRLRFILELMPQANKLLARGLLYNALKGATSYDLIHAIRKMKEIGIQITSEDLTVKHDSKRSLLWLLMEFLQKDMLKSPREKIDLFLEEIFCQEKVIWEEDLDAFPVNTEHTSKVQELLALIKAKNAFLRALNTLENLDTLIALAHEAYTAGYKPAYDNLIETLVANGADKKMVFKVYEAIPAKCEKYPQVNEEMAVYYRAQSLEADTPAQRNAFMLKAIKYSLRSHNEVQSKQYVEDYTGREVPACLLTAKDDKTLHLLGRYKALGEAEKEAKRLERQSLLERTAALEAEIKTLRESARALGKLI